jgi:hypothetical protein
MRILWCKPLLLLDPITWCRSSVPRCWRSSSTSPFPYPHRFPTTTPPLNDTQDRVGEVHVPGLQLGWLGFTRCVKRPMGLRSVGEGVTVADRSSSSGGDHNDGEVMNPITGGPPSGPLGPDLGARVLVGRPCSPMWIRVVKWRSDSSSGARKISTGSSSSSSSSLAPPCLRPMAR